MWAMCGRKDLTELGTFQNCNYSAMGGSIISSATISRLFAKSKKLHLIMKVDPVRSPMYSSFQVIFIYLKAIKFYNKSPNPLPSNPQASCLLKNSSTFHRKHTVKTLVHHNSRVEKRQDSVLQSSTNVIIYFEQLILINGSIGNSVKSPSLLLMNHIILD